MSQIEELKAKVRKLERIKKQLEETLSTTKTLNKELRKKRNYLTKRIKVLEKSRDGWKEKHKYKQQNIKLLKEKIKRQDKAKWHHYPSMLVTLCIFLRTKCNCSYQSVVKILKILNVYFHLHLTRIPCANTVQNWVSKVGLFQLEDVCKQLAGQQVSIIIDESIRLGQEKLLLVLVCPFLKQSEEALSFTDVKVVYMRGSKSWKGVEIEKVVRENLQNQGLNVVNVLSDQGNNLVNATKLLGLDHVPDIGHALATCLRQTFEKEPDYKVVIKLFTSYLLKGVNQDLSYLIPPRLGKKARFMNLSKLVHWSELMLNNWEKLNEKEKDFFAELPEHKEMIEILGTCITNSPCKKEEAK